MDRFRRTEQLLGKEVFSNLQSKSVTVVGLGAVGGYVLEGLARAGVQHIRIVDFDTIQTSNINRQIIALESTLGRPKAEVLQERLYDINPNCIIEALPIFASEETLEEILSPEPDLLIDAIDSLNPKTQLLHGAYIRKSLPLVLWAQHFAPIQHSFVLEIFSIPLIARWQDISEKDYEDAMSDVVLTASTLQKK